MGDRPTLIVATSLPERECRALEDALARSWQGGPPPAIRWIRPRTGEPPAVLIEHGARVDVLLGGPPGSYDRLVRRGLLYKREDEPWVVFRRPDVAVAARPAVFEARAMPPPADPSILVDPRLGGLIGLDDPRIDAAARGFCSAQLPAASWADGYAVLVRATANAAPISREAGTARARLDRGEVAIAAVFAASVPNSERIELLDRKPGPVECMAVSPTTTRPELAARLLTALADALAATIATAPDPAAGLLADLLGATLVDAQPELALAREALNRMPAGARSRQLEGYLVQPPPWPPTSVSRLGESELVELLAAQVAPGLDARGWLLQSWESPPQPLDGRQLERIATVAGGKLASDPRFRAWLRAEWTAWACQNYRRVAREAERATTAAHAGAAS